MSDSPPHESYIMGLRKLVGHRRLIVPGIRALIFDDAGRILLQRRRDSGEWGMPAGSVELGDSVYKTLVKEVWEETGLEVLSARPMGVYSDPEQFIYIYPNGDEIQIFSLAFIVDRWRGELGAHDDETLELAFFPLDKLPGNLHGPHRGCVEDYLAFDGTFIVK